MTKKLTIYKDGGLSPENLLLVEQMAAQHKSKRTIAVALGISFKAFEKMLDRDKGENAERLAWERGFAQYEQHVSDVMHAAAMGELVTQRDKDGNEVLDDDGKPIQLLVLSKNATTALIYLTKAQLGWSEKPTGPLVQDNRIQITVPDAMKWGDMLTALGQKEVLDFRKDKTIPLKEIAPPLVGEEPPDGSD